MSKTIRRLGFLALSLCLAAGVLAATHNIWLRWLGESAWSTANLPAKRT